MHFDMGDWRVRLVPLDCFEMAFDQIEIRVFRRVGDVYEVLQPDATVVQVGIGERADHLKPFALLPTTSLQSLMEQLWERGIRPKSRRYEEETSLLREVIETQKRHLGDMRAVAFDVAKNSHSGDKVLRFLHESDEVKR